MKTRAGVFAGNVVTKPSRAQCASFVRGCCAALASGAANKAVMSPELRNRIVTGGAEPIGSSPAAFQQHLAREIAKWRKAVPAAGVKMR